MNEILTHILNVVRNDEMGTLAAYPDPADPADLGSALTQDEIDTLKKFIKEIKERFTLL